MKRKVFMLLVCTLLMTSVSGCRIRKVTDVADNAPINQGLAPIIEDDSSNPSPLDDSSDSSVPDIEDITTDTPSNNSEVLEVNWGGQQLRFNTIDGITPIYKDGYTNIVEYKSDNFAIDYTYTDVASNVDTSTMEENVEIVADAFSGAYPNFKFESSGGYSLNLGDTSGKFYQYILKSKEDNAGYYVCMQDTGLPCLVAFTILDYTGNLSSCDDLIASWTLKEGYHYEIIQDNYSSDNNTSPSTTLDDFLSNAEPENPDLNPDTTTSSDNLYVIKIGDDSFGYDLSYLPGYVPVTISDYYISFSKDSNTVSYADSFIEVGNTEKTMEWLQEGEPTSTSSNYALGGKQCYIKVKEYNTYKTIDVLQDIGLSNYLAIHINVDSSVSDKDAIEYYSIELY